MLAVIRKPWVILGLILVGVLVVGVWYWNTADSPTQSTKLVSQPSGDFLQMPKAAQTGIAPTLDVAAQARANLVQRVEFADQTLCAYQRATQYPPNSRPMSEHPDQIYPNRVIVRSQFLRKNDGNFDPAIQIQLGQSRVFLAANESVLLTLKATNAQGKVLPLAIQRVVAQGIATTGTSRGAAQVNLSMTDDGRNGDEQAGDGVFSTTLLPAQSGFGSFAGTIGVDIDYSVDGQATRASFDVIYTPEFPATWLGAVRETLENGSINLYLKANVRMAGRYLVTGRVDDAQGKPVALLQFNDQLAQGPQEIPLSLNGKLMRDLAPLFPLTLRDVDGYLLKEDADPDRALMPRLIGRVHTTKLYANKDLSDQEWQSEQRTRYLNEYRKDLQNAQAALIEFDPDQARMPMPQSECSRTQLLSK